MHISASHTIEHGKINVEAITVATRDDWNYVVSLGYGTNIYLSRSELVSLTNQSIRLIADAWATEAADAE